MEDVNKRPGNFLLFLNLSSVPKKSTPGKFAYIRYFQRTKINATKFEKTPIHFKSDIFAAVAVVDAKSPLWYPPPWYLRTSETMRDVFCFVPSSPLSVICSHKLFLYWLNFQNRWVWTFLLWPRLEEEISSLFQNRQVLLFRGGVGWD